MDRPTNRGSLHVAVPKGNCSRKRQEGETRHKEAGEREIEGEGSWLYGLTAKMVVVGRAIIIKSLLKFGHSRGFIAS